MNSSAENCCITYSLPRENPARRFAYTFPHIRPWSYEDPPTSSLTSGRDLLPTKSEEILDSFPRLDGTDDQVQLSTALPGMIYSDDLIPHGTGSLPVDINLLESREFESFSMPPFPTATLRDDPDHFRQLERNLEKTVDTVSSVEDFILPLQQDTIETLADTAAAKVGELMQWIHARGDQSSQSIGSHAHDPEFTGSVGGLPCFGRKWPSENQSTRAATTFASQVAVNGTSTPLLPGVPNLKALGAQLQHDIAAPSFMPNNSFESVEGFYSATCSTTSSTSEVLQDDGAYRDCKNLKKHRSRLGATELATRGFPPDSEAKCPAINEEACAKPCQILAWTSKLTCDDARVAEERAWRGEEEKKNGLFSEESWKEVAISEEDAAAAATAWREQASEEYAAAAGGGGGGEAGMSYDAGMVNLKGSERKRKADESTYEQQAMASTRRAMVDDLEKQMLFMEAAFRPMILSADYEQQIMMSGPKRRNVRISKDPQSVAARHRREKISAKIRMLQSLVPGCSKMDTASMLEEAVQYIKFLKNLVKEMKNLENGSRPDLIFSSNASIGLQKLNHRPHPSSMIEDGAPAAHLLRSVGGGGGGFIAGSAPPASIQAPIDAASIQASIQAPAIDPASIPAPIDPHSSILAPPPHASTPSTHQHHSHLLPPSNLYCNPSGHVLPHHLLLL